ncbi:Conserved_hypothetical protein [Hexamita inflata]|uniref:Uncharacterized protein n=1 Tax=Hexamita inflata TaxID=28002 RepID=A0AA86PBW7_9EUKA|nr:Conserved hypothetical protein [Hexamita inflata]
MLSFYIISAVVIQIHKQISQLKNFASITQICNQKLHFNKVTIQYCNKQASLAQLTQSTQIIYPSEGTTYVALYTEAVQNLIVNYSFSQVSLPSFALFGLVKTNIQIQSSKLSVETPDLYQGALICFQCDLNASHAEFVFLSSGKALSGLILHGLNYMDLGQVLVQFRLNGDILGGLCSLAGKMEMSLKETNISGYFTGTRCGALISFVTETVKIQVQNTRVCRNGVPNIFQGSDLAQISEPLFEDCTVCGDKYYAYGLCLLTLKNGVIQSLSMVCASQFVFDGQDCVCPEGQIQNGSECYNVLNAMNQIIDKDLSLQFQMGLKSNPNVLSVDQKLLNNISALSQYVNNDISAINNNIINIETTLNERVLEDNYLQNRKNQLTAQIQDFVYKIACNRQYGYSWQNGQCALLSCSVEGQAAINGVCQCPGIFQYVLNNKCVCPENSAVIAGICTCTVIGQIPQNQVCVCTTNNAFVKDGACTCGVFGLNISNTCSCPVNSNIVAGTCTCNVIYGQSMIDSSCQCASPQTMVDGKCKFVVNSVNVDYICSQQLYVTSFDILEITNTINGVADFSSGYVFSTANVITNAFINIVDAVYKVSSQLSPLFQSQSSFANIKIQICSQTTINGAFMTPATIIEINQMYIYSKLETSFSVATYLYLIETTYTSASNRNINNLAINLNISALLGNFALINSITGPLTIQNYSVKGRYNSQGTFTFLGIAIQSSTLVVTNVSIAPTNFVVGNSSSYLFSSSNACTLSLSQISVIIGNSTNNQVTALITSTTTNFYQFGGYISYLISTTLQAANLIYAGYLYYNTQITMYSGLLVGYSNSNANKIIIQNLCFYSYVSDADCSFYSFGLVGQNNGNISIQQANIVFNASLFIANAVGIIAAQSDTSAYSEMINVWAAVVSYFTLRGESGALMGQQKGQSFVVQNCTIKGSSIYAKCYVGSVVGSLLNELLIKNTTAISTNLTSTDNSTGGFIGWSSECHFTVSNSSIQNVRMATPSRIGMILGRNYGGTTYTLYNSWSVSNYMNTYLQPNCAVFTYVDDYGC